MDPNRFDDLLRGLTGVLPRRGLLGLAALLGAGAAAPAAAKKGVRNKKGAQKKCSSTRQCKPGLKCGKPTTRHSCSSTVGAVRKWCCVPPGGRCSGCECCGNYYCGGDGRCIPNPEG